MNIERSPYLIERTDDGTFLVRDPAYPRADSSVHIRGRGLSEIEAINLANRLWQEDLEAANYASKQ